MRFFFLLLAMSVSQISANAFDDIWTCAKSFRQGKKLAMKQGKPLCLLNTRGWCGDSQELYEDCLKNAAQLQSYAKQFIFVNVDKRGTSGDNIKYDGVYWPRIYFYKPNGKFLENVGTSNAKFHYFYRTADKLEASLKLALSSINSKKTT